LIKKTEKKRKHTTKYQAGLVLRDTVTPALKIRTIYINLGAFMQNRIKGQIMHSLPRNVKLNQAGSIS